jgi:ArsR family transcriptional regulator, virulence genes transcriptional regulator
MTTLSKTKPAPGSFLKTEEREILKNGKNKIRALYHPLREKIMALIDGNKNEMNVTEIYVKLRIEQSVASQHLAILRNEGFVTARRDGKIIYYSVNHDEIKRCIAACKNI